MRRRGRGRGGGHAARGRARRAGRRGACGRSGRTPAGGADAGGLRRLSRPRSRRRPVARGARAAREGQRGAAERTEERGAPAPRRPSARGAGPADLWARRPTRPGPTRVRAPGPDPRGARAEARGREDVGGRPRRGAAEAGRHHPPLERQPAGPVRDQPAHRGARAGPAGGRPSPSAGAPRLPLPSPPAAGTPPPPAGPAAADSGGLAGRRVERGHLRPGPGSRAWSRGRGRGRSACPRPGWGSRARRGVPGPVRVVGRGWGRGRRTGPGPGGGISAQTWGVPGRAWGRGRRLCGGPAVGGGRGRAQSYPIYPDPHAGVRGAPCLWALRTFVT